MKKLFHQIPGRLFFLLNLLACLFLSANVWAQRPKNIPRAEDSEPLSLDTLPQILIYIGLPVLFFLLYLWLRKKKSNHKN